MNRLTSNRSDLHQISRRSEEFLSSITLNQGSSFPADDLAVVVAHPDDEALGIGGLLGHLQGVITIHLTDGAPRRTSAASRNGYPTVELYKAVRRKELKLALKIAGVPAENQIALGIPDQEAWLYLCETAFQLAVIFQETGCNIVLSHPYEGGHPDHDAAAFVVRAASDILVAADVRPPTIIEMAFYHLAGGTRVDQQFIACSGSPEKIVTLNAQQRTTKKRMLDAHVSQARVLADFSVEEERFRLAPRYDFGRLPNRGQILYETYDWWMTGSQWLRRASSATDEIKRRTAEGAGRIAAI